MKQNIGFKFKCSHGGLALTQYMLSREQRKGWIMPALGSEYKLRISEGLSPNATGMHFIYSLFYTSGFEAS